MANNKPPTNGFDKRPEDINKGGRPKKGMSLTETILSKLSLDEIADKVIQLLKEKDPTTLRFVYNHIDGMPVQKNVLAGDAEQPVRLIIGGSDDREVKSDNEQAAVEGSGDIGPDDGKD